MNNLCFEPLSHVFVTKYSVLRKCEEYNAEDCFSIK